MMSLGTSLKAQEILIALDPGWNWISYPNAGTMGIASAFGDFTPMQGDIVRSKDGGQAVFSNGIWVGSLKYLIPGRGYHYYSSRTEYAEFVFAQPASDVVATATPTDITATSAVVGGMVILPEGTHVFLRGVCWGTEPNPDIDGDHTSEEPGLGSFSSTLEGLILGTTYYVRAYVVSDHGLAYGDEVSFTTQSGIPVVSTAEVTDITATTATCGGTVTDGGGLEITARGICWSTSHNPTLNNNHTSDGTGTGSFGCSLIALSPGTTYYVRAYATTMQATSYGEEISFTTLSGIPTVSTAEVNDITTNSAICGGTVADDGGLSIIARGVCWSMGHDPTLNDNYTTDGTGIGSFSSSLTGLLDNTTYYVRAYATNSYMTVYGSEVGFVTEQIPNYTIGVSSNPSDGGTVSGGGTYQMGTNCTLTVTANEGYTFTNWTENGEVVSTEATYSFMVSGNRTLVANFFIPTYVDLGLPRGTLWATCNVGAETPEDYGDYFAWGETQPKDIYNWGTYQYCMGSINTLTKYCNNTNYGYNGFTDSLTILLPEDDAATANWGADWRLPTKEEWQELYNNTTCTWKTQNGVIGRLFTASNGNSLFLPAAGCRYDSSLSSEGSNGYYWSSSLNTDCPYDALSFFYAESCSMDYYGIRYDGRSVRPVRSLEQNNAPVGAINGKFTINANGDQVYFSQGNLQYIGSASTPYWKFADNQWDRIEEGQGTSNSACDRDLFGWGTSGYNHGAICYEPWSISTTNTDYKAYGVWTNNLYDESGEADWGYNAISNGGNTEDFGWFTLSQSEWDYLFNTRSTPSGIRWANATIKVTHVLVPNQSYYVDNISGLILLPDDWDESYYSLNSPNTIGGYNNTIDASVWIDNLQLRGAVFLPRNGYRRGFTVYGNANGYYWSSSYENAQGAYAVGFSSNSFGAAVTHGRCVGLSVRLVRYAQ